MQISDTYSSKERIDLPLQLVGIGLDYLQEPINRPNGTQFYQLFCCTNGVGEIIINNRRCNISKGQGMFFIPGKPQIYYAVKPGWKVDYIIFTGSQCTAILNSLGFSEPAVFSYTKPDVFRKHIQNINQINKSHRQNKDLLYSKECYDLLIDIAFLVNKLDTVSIADTNNLVARAIDYMEHNYANDLSLNEIAANIGLSKEHLCRIYKNNTHETLIETLTKIRLYHACRMLTQYPDMHANRIGEECGFRSSSYFGVVFKKYEGMTPNSYRLHGNRSIIRRMVK